MFDKDNQILYNEIKDFRRALGERSRRFSTLETSVWVVMFLNAIIIGMIAILIIGSNT